MSKKLFGKENLESTVYALAQEEQGDLAICRFGHEFPPTFTTHEAAADYRRAMAMTGVYTIVELRVFDV